MNVARNDGWMDDLPNEEEVYRLHGQWAYLLTEIPAPISYVGKRRFR